MPNSGIVTMTAFGASTPANPSTKPRSVILTASQAAVLQNEVSKIPKLSLSARLLLCMEQATVFTVSVKESPHSRAVWVAQAHLCPAPGILAVHGTDVGQPRAGRYCTLKNLVLSYFPKGSINGTKMLFGFCR